MLGRIYTSQIHNYVPKLIRLDKTAQFDRPSANKKDLELYKLDWDSVDEYKNKQHAEWIYGWKDKLPPDFKDRPPPTLPQHYDVIVKNIVYAVPVNYLREVWHFTSLYVSEWNRERSFDTTIREMCYQPAIAAINCAFKLLDDCIYDVDKRNWFRSSICGDGKINKLALRHLTLYKYWRQFTGDGLVWGHAELNELEDLVRWLGPDSVYKKRKEDKELFTIYSEVISTMRKWEEQEQTFKPPIKGLSVEDDQITSLEIKMVNSEFTSQSTDVEEQTNVGSYKIPRKMPKASDD